MKRKHIGRPLLYPHLLVALKDEVVYSPAAVANHACKLGLLTEEQLADLARTRVRIRHTLARMAFNHQFPKEGDGIVRLPGQSIAIGWRGKRWKSVLNPNEKTRGERILLARVSS